MDISALDFVRKIICRASNRIIVGEQKCRDEDWVNLNVEYTSDAMETRNVLTMLPHVVKPCAIPPSDLPTIIELTTFQLCCQVSPYPFQAIKAGHPAPGAYDR